MNRLDALNKASLKKGVPSFRTGDTVKVHVKVIEEVKAEAPVAKEEVAAETPAAEPVAEVAETPATDAPADTDK